MKTGNLIIRNTQQVIWLLDNLSEYRRLYIKNKVWVEHKPIPSKLLKDLANLRKPELAIELEALWNKEWKEWKKWKKQKCG